MTRQPALDRRISGIAGWVGLVMAAAGLGFPAIAQIDEPAGPPPETVAPTPKEVAPLEDAKIDQFADAYLAIEKIQAEAATALKNTDDPDEASRLKEAAESRIIEAVERSGLRLEEFNQIAELMQVDLELRTKIVERVQKRRGS